MDPHTGHSKHLEHRPPCSAASADGRLSRQWGQKNDSSSSATQSPHSTRWHWRHAYCVHSGTASPHSPHAKSMADASIGFGLGFGKK